MGIAALHPSYGSAMKRPRTEVRGFAFRDGFQVSLFRLADGNFQRADAVDAALDVIAGVELGDAGGRARHDDVARSEFYLLRELPDDLGHAPDQFGEIALLRFLAVDGQPDLALGGMADLRGRLDRGAGRGIVEGFSDFPRPLLLARGELQVAAGEVDADGVAVDMVERLVGGNVQSAALRGDGQVDLVLRILGQRRV